MRFNPDPNKQAQGVYFSRKTTKEHLSFNGSNVETCYSQKHLAIIMDNKLNFDVHVQNKISKCNKMIGIVKQLSIILPQDALLTLYKMFIRMHLDYPDIIYDKLNPLSADPTKWSNTLKTIRRLLPTNCFECV